MYNKEKSEKIIKIIQDYKNSSNKDLTLAMEHINEDFKFTKNMVIKGTEQLDKLELSYNTLLKEYQERTKSNDNR